MAAIVEKDTTLSSLKGKVVVISGTLPYPSKMSKVLTTNHRERERNRCGNSSAAAFMWL